jgi:ParB-like chromosome segregation protein Spo0J
MNTAKLSFQLKTVQLVLADILPVRVIKDPENVKRYESIRSSIKEVGMIEPLVVHPQKSAPGNYLLLDGHLRFYALKSLNLTQAECLIADDDEAFTYNARVNRLNPIAQHKMIMKAVQNGVRPERIAAALSLPMSRLKTSMTLLEGINEEAVELLKDKPVSPKVICLLRKVTGVRQIEIAELMVSAGNFTKPYAEALVLGTPKDQLLLPQEPKKKKGMTREEIAKLELELDTLERDLKSVEQTYGENMLNLTAARAYIKKLVENAKVVRFLNSNYREILSDFESIVAVETL